VQNLPADPRDLDREISATVHHLYAHDDSLGPSPEFAGRLLRDILANAATGSPPLDAISPAHTIVGTRQEHGVHAGARHPAASAARPRWPALPFATLALILVTVIVSVMAFADVGPWPKVLELVSLPVSTMPSGLITDSVLVQGTVSDIPAERRLARIGRTLLPAGADWTFDENDSAGPRLYRVESGALTVTADGPITVTRGEASQANAVPAGMDVVLESGDQGFTPAGVHARWRNDGTAPASILDVRITSSTGVPPADVTLFKIADDAAFVPPSSSFVVTLQRMVLPPAAALRVDDVPGLRLLSIESGDVRALDSQHPDGFRVVNGTDATRTFPPGRTLEATGAEPATLLLLTVTPATQ